MSTNLQFFPHISDFSFEESDQSDIHDFSEDIYGFDFSSRDDQFYPQEGFPEFQAPLPEAIPTHQTKVPVSIDLRKLDLETKFPLIAPIEPHAPWEKSSVKGSPSSASSPSKYIFVNESPNNFSPHSFKRKTDSPSGKKTAAPQRSSMDVDSPKPAVKKACISCKKAHTKCDRQNPCQRCIQLNIGHLCSNSIDERHGIFLIALFGHFFKKTNKQTKQTKTIKYQQCLRNRSHSDKVAQKKRAQRRPEEAHAPFQNQEDLFHFPDEGRKLCALQKKDKKVQSH